MAREVFQASALRPVPQWRGRDQERLRTLPVAGRNPHAAWSDAGDHETFLAASADPARARSNIRSAGKTLWGVSMKARVYVTFKPSVLDPQGQTIRAALNGLGHKGIEDVRQGKYFELTLQPDEDLEAIARDVLSNPVIEDYRIEIIG
jgi:phosphoribosylformylglycinamidine synthase PurS subunit